MRDDRHYGSMGGLGRIYYQAISRYADDNGIVDTAFDHFLIFVRVIDDEYVAVSNERAKTEAERAKQNKT